MGPTLGALRQGDGPGGATAARAAAARAAAWKKADSAARAALGGYITGRVAGGAEGVYCFIPTETLVLNGTPGDNGTAGGTLNQAVLWFLVG